MIKSGLVIGNTIQGCKDTYKVERVISEDGGQGGVYLVNDSNGKKMAAKWYWQSKKHQAELLQQRAHIESLYNEGMPSALQSQTYITWVWPLDFISNEQSFGYIMDYLDLENTYDYETVRAHQEEGKWDHKMLCEMCIKLCHGFNILNMSGYCYKDINRDNIAFNAITNEIYIVDPDNIAIDDKDEYSDVGGTSGFIAPEILKGESKPNTKSDLWSLSVFMFILWFKEHPLEGKLSEGALDSDYASLYSNPIFIYHPTNKKNAADGSEFDWVNSFWNAAPKEIKEKFLIAFTEGCNPRNRISELSWIRCLEKVINNDLHTCPSCKRMVAKEASLCGYCRKIKKVEIEQRTKEEKTEGNIPQSLLADMKKPARINIFEDQIRIKTIPLYIGIKFSGKDISKRLTDYKLFGEIIENPKTPEGLAIKNLTFVNWSYENAKGKRGIIEPGRSLKIKHNTKFWVGAGVALKFKLQ